MARILYRYDERLFEVDEVMTKDGDHVGRLTSDQLAAEMALRAVSCEKFDIRERALFAWDDYQLAREYGAYLGRPYLYLLNVEEENVLFESDVGHYTDVIAAIKMNKPADDAIRRYWDNEPSADPKARKEVLFTVGTVLSREATPTKAQVRKEKASHDWDADDEAFYTSINDKFSDKE